MWNMALPVAKPFSKGNNAFVVCIHTDKAHIHNYIIWNSVTLDCDRKFRNFWGSTKAVRQLNDTICIENGLSIVENPKPHGKSYNKCLGDAAKQSHGELLRIAIDNALLEKPETMETLFALLQQAGVQIKKRGKSISLQPPGQGRFVRMDTLGDESSEAALSAVLVDEKAHKPRKKKLVKAEPEPEHYNLLAVQIKAAEKRMAEIAVLRTQIINYSKTRDVYAAYSKDGYSKRFLAEHEADVLLHKAAKKAFDKLEVKKLPRVKELQSEYKKFL